MSKRPLAVLLFLSLLLSAAGAFADDSCRCKRKPAVWKDFRRASAVFTGVVEAEGDGVLRLRVTEAWKGISMGEVRIELVRSPSEECGYSFEPRVYYMVYAYEYSSQELRELWVSRCSRTRPSAEANRDREIIGKPKWIRWSAPKREPLDKR